ncbi:MAG TPA: tRNA pseudouridine(38-40) synthase TruA [Niabella sp.]|nr:tRNA pseudouridine(38-40) synthase TruA [Niabella sp.]
MRYFLEVAYKGTRYSGFQAQKNARTIQGEIEKAFRVFFKELPHLGGEDGKGFTGSSRTDAGVHALQNFFHFDWEEQFQQKWIYNLNAILPGDIVIKNVITVAGDAHCRFDALSRTYHYHIYQYKDPFIADRAYFYPYTMDVEKLNQAAAVIQAYTDFTSFSKKNTQVKTFNCTILQSEWMQREGQLIYVVSANRFLRGMVRALTATMLKVGRGILSVEDLHTIIQSKDCSKAFFDTPAHGLTLVEVTY